MTGLRPIDTLQTTTFEVHTRRHPYAGIRMTETLLISHHLSLFRARMVTVPKDGAHTARQKEENGGDHLQI